MSSGHNQLLQHMFYFSCQWHKTPQHKQSFVTCCDKNQSCNIPKVFTTREQNSCLTWIYQENKPVPLVSGFFLCIAVMYYVGCDLSWDMFSLKHAEKWHKTQHRATAGDMVYSCHDPTF